MPHPTEQGLLCDDARGIRKVLPYEARHQDDVRDAHILASLSQIAQGTRRNASGSEVDVGSWDHQRVEEPLVRGHGWACRRRLEVVWAAQDVDDHVEPALPVNRIKIVALQHD